MAFTGAGQLGAGGLELRACAVGSRAVAVLNDPDVFLPCGSFSGSFSPVARIWNVAQVVSSAGF